MTPGLESKLGLQRCPSDKFAFSPSAGRKLASGDVKPVAVLKAEPDELTERLNIKFTDGRDDLDLFREAAVRLESGRWLLLVR